MESGSWRRPISLKFNLNEIVLLLGRNNAGKTTLLNTIAGLVPENSGEIWFNSQNITGFSELERIRYGIRIALEGRQIFSRLTVRQNLLLGAFNEKKGADITRRIEWITNVFPDLKLKIDDRAGTLSGGQQTQLNIGRALMGNPRLLLLDEPTLGLDPINIKKLIEALIYINEKQNVTLIIAEQSGLLSKYFSERIILFYSGEIIFDGGWEKAVNEGKASLILP